MILNYDFTYLAILLSDPEESCTLPAAVRGQPRPAPGVPARNRRPWSWRRMRA